jgi:hypothetical protein
MASNQIGPLLILAYRNERVPARRHTRRKRDALSLQTLAYWVAECHPVRQ